jgi:hypothetical protein
MLGLDGKDDKSHCIDVKNTCRDETKRKRAFWKLSKVERRTLFQRLVGRVPISKIRRGVKMRILLSKKMLQKAHACAPVVIAMFLDNDTLISLLAARAGKKGCTGGILENFAYAFTGAGRAF